MTWITTEDYASLLSISPQAARKRLRKLLQTNAAPAGFRQVVGRGGRAGVRYEIALNSLSESLQRAFREQHANATDALACNGNDFRCIEPAKRIVPAPNQSAEVLRRWRTLEAILDHPRGSAERAAEIERASRRDRVPVRTIHGWIKRLDDAGGDIAALGRARPSDAGKARVVVSRAFDRRFRAAGYPDDLLAEIGEKATQLVRAAWASPAQRHGWTRVRLEALTALRRECRDRGIDLPASAFHLSRRRVEDHAFYRRVDIYNHDRKAFDDAKPRIMRDNASLRPMQLVCGDVQPNDCIVRRPDGTGEFTVKLIAFQDVGTHRLFPYFVQVDPGQGIRQEHIAEAFSAMVADPEWGFPETLYLDNGTEFKILAKQEIKTALAMLGGAGDRCVIHAKPYSGASKPIESTFSMLNRAIFSQMDGWTGGDRMNKKTQQVGQKTKPYKGSFEDFVVEAKLRRLDFESWPLQSGSFKGKSPSDAYAEHVAAGWRPTAVDRLALDASFCKFEQKQVRGGVIRISGVVYQHDELAGLNGRFVAVSLPWRRGAAPLFKHPKLGWVGLDPRMPHLPLDTAGALASGRSQRREMTTIRDLRAEAGSIDLAANLNDRVAALPSRATPAPLMDALMSSEAQEIAAARDEAERKRLAAPSAIEREVARMNAETEELERHYGLRRRR